MRQVAARPGSAPGYAFSPSIKWGYDISKRIAFGTEHYGPYGAVTGFDPLREPFHQLIPAVDVEFGKNWEFNFGVGMGFTQNNERLLLKAILGYRFNFKGTS